MVQAQNLVPIQKEKKGKYALSKNDSLITDFVYTELGPFTENCAFANQGELYAYIDTNGNALTSWMFETVTSFENGLAVVGDSAGVGMIDSAFNTIIPFQFLSVKKSKSQRVSVQDTTEKWGVFSLDIGLIIPCEYDYPPIEVSEMLFIVIKDNQYGVVNHQNVIIYPLNYQYISKGGLAYKDDNIQILKFD
jgi:hypothetical protein